MTTDFAVTLSGGGDTSVFVDELPTWREERDNQPVHTPRATAPAWAVPIKGEGAESGGGVRRTAGGWRIDLCVLLRRAELA